MADQQVTEAELEDDPASEEYVSAEHERLAVFALRHTVPLGLVTAVIFAILNYLLATRDGDVTISWYGVDSSSFIAFYLPSAFIMPIIQTPLILRRTLQLRMQGKLPPPLASLENVPWLQQGLFLGVVAGGIVAAIVMTFVSILAIWVPEVRFGVWFGLLIRILLTAIIGANVGILCAIAGVRMKPQAPHAAHDQSDNDADLPTTPEQLAAQTLRNQRVSRGRLEIPTTPHGPIRWNRFRYGVRPEVMHRTEQAVYFSADQRRAFIQRFFTLLSISCMIAYFGLTSDSPSVVLAAMLIAPTMTPISALTIALVTGRPRRQLEALALLGSAVGFVIVLSWLLGTMMPERPAVPSTLLDYTDPRLADLCIALLAGVVGMYILVHTEASTALPGVAVALSLEPPIVSSGIMLAWGYDGLAIGAFVMFIVNLVAIIAAGAVVLVLSGFLPFTRSGDTPRRVKGGLLIAAVLVIVIAIPIGRFTVASWEQGKDRANVGSVATKWADAADYDVIDVEIKGDEVTLDVEGATPPASIDGLSADIAETLGREVEVILRFHPYAQIEQTAGP